MNLDVVTPEGAKIKGLEVLEVTVPGVAGELGILQAHEAFATALKVGVMTVVTTTGSLVYAVAGGFLSVLGEEINILTETCERADEIDRPRAEVKLDEALKELAQLAPVDGETYKAALNSVRKAETRLMISRPASSD